MNVIAISNQKGGTAKTTTAAAFAVLLSRAGFRVHLVDSDPQASLTMAFGLTEPDGLLYQAMCQRGPLPVVTLAVLDATPRGGCFEDTGDRFPLDSKQAKATCVLLAFAGEG
jgi:cellulose biosynthesis protein BcsQ